MKKISNFLDSIFMKVYEYKPLNKILSNTWYSIVGLIDKNNEIVTMNYGFSEKGNEIELKPEDEKDRYSLQLYNYLVKDVVIENKEILEVGCGRGGGASYVARYLSPRRYIGVDITKRSISFNSKKNKNVPNLKFQVADAHNLPFENGIFDVVINVETSHHYQDFLRFLSEVRRVLKSGGLFLLTDYCHIEKFEAIKRHLTASGMSIIKNEDITPRVLEALDRDGENRKQLIHRLCPKIFWKVATDFSGVPGSDLYNSFKTGEWVYFNFVLKN